MIFLLYCGLSRAIHNFGFVFVFVLLSSTVFIKGAASDDGKANSDFENAKTEEESCSLDFGVFNWLNAQPNGFYNPKQILTTSDDNGLLGIIATEFIPKDEILCQVPWDVIAKDPHEVEDEQLSCGLVRYLTEELHKGGDASIHGPWIDYLLQQSDNQLASNWSQEGKELILKVLGQTAKDNNHPKKRMHFPPNGMTNWIEDGWFQDCRGDPEDKMGIKAALMALLRADDGIMIPGYDFYNHRNGIWNNADTHIYPGVSHVTVATRDIQPGEQVYISYNRCDQCGSRRNGYGTQEIFRDYGFIENFPQRWHYYDDDVIEFELDLTKDGFYVIDWVHEPLDIDEIEVVCDWLEKEILRLNRLRYIQYGGYNHSSVGMIEREWNDSWAFQRANLVAMKVAFQALNGDSRLPVISFDNEMNEKPSANDLYHSHNSSNFWQGIDLEDYECKFKEFSRYPIIETMYNHMEKVDVSQAKNMIEQNTCLSRGGHRHICTSYQPIYYESLVHPAASLLHSVQRVLIIASGASFYLEEILMHYASTIQKILVIEFDSTIAHLSKKYFGVDSQFDDPRVEWWFGDAGEVLSLIPETAWGSFDLVIVDTEKQNFPAIFRNGRSMTDLISPTGILVSKGGHLRETSTLPFACRMAVKLSTTCVHIWTLSSFSVDFMQSPSYNHKMQETRFFKQSMMNKDNRLRLIQDWQALDQASYPRRSTTLHFEAPLGAISMLDIRNVTSGLNSINSRIEDVLELGGFSIVSFLSLIDGRVCLFSLERGYILARQEGAYVGLDIHLPINITKLPLLLESFQRTMEGSTVNSFTVMASGIEKPRLFETHEDSNLSLPSMHRHLAHPQTENFIKIILEVLMRSTLLDYDERIENILVVCEAFTNCSTFYSIQKDNPFMSVLMLELPTGTSIENMVSAEINGNQWLQSNVVEKGRQVKTLILDRNLSLSSSKILDSLLNVDIENRQDWLSPNATLVSILSTEDYQICAQHRSIMERFHREKIAKKNRFESAFNAEYASFSSHSIPLTQTLIATKGKHATSELAKSIETNLDQSMAEFESKVRLLRFRSGSIYSNRTLLGGSRFKEQKSEHVAHRMQPHGVQAIIQTEVFPDENDSIRPVSFASIVAWCFAALKNHEMKEVKKLNTGTKDMVIFEFADGYLIVTAYADAFDFNFFYHCHKDKICDFNKARYIAQELKSVPTLYVFSIQYFVRGTDKNMVL